MYASFAACKQDIEFMDHCLMTAINVSVDVEGSPRTTQSFAKLKQLIYLGTPLTQVEAQDEFKKRLSDKMTLTEKENQHFEINFALQNVLVESNLYTNAFGDGSTKVLRVPNTESRMLV